MLMCFKFAVIQFLSWESILVPFSRFLLWIRILKAQVWLKMLLFQIHVWKPFIQESLLLFDLVHSIQDHCIFHKKKTFPSLMSGSSKHFQCCQQKQPTAQMVFLYFCHVMMAWLNFDGDGDGDDDLSDWLIFISLL